MRARGGRRAGTSGILATMWRVRSGWALLTLMALACERAGDRDVAPPPIPPGVVVPRAFGEGFVDRSRALDPSPPFALSPFDPMRFQDPGWSIALAADLDGDRAEEVVLVSVDAAPRIPPTVYGVGADGALRRRDDLVLPAEPVGALLDLDGDGALDLLSALGSVGWGLGAGRFAPLTPFTNVARSDARLNVVVDDLDRDGWLDLLIGLVCCSGGPGNRCYTLRPLFRTAPRAYTDRVELIPETIPGKPYAVLSAPLDGEPFIAQVGWSCVNPQQAETFYRETGTGPDGYPRYAARQPQPPEAVRDDSGPTSLAAQSPMGAAVGDLDGDGRMDLAVMLNPLHLLLQGHDRWPMRDRTQASGVAVLYPDSGRNPMLPWGVALVDFDRDGRLDMLVAHGNDTGGWFDPRVFTGPQHSSALWNAGDFRFADVTPSVGDLGHRGHYHQLITCDLQRDGDADVLVGGVGEIPRVFENRIATGRHGLSLRLRGTTSNHLGVGARVDVAPAAGLPAQHHIAGAAAAGVGTGEPLVFVTSGAATVAPPLRITWPSGYVQVLSGLAADRLHEVFEPETLAIAPPSRHLPADGRAAAMVRVTPRGTDGAPREGRVTLRVVLGAGVVGTPARDGPAWVFPVTAPSAAGSTVLEASIDGVALAVRPRLWWDG